MKNKIIIGVLTGLASLIIVIKLLTIFVVEPWLGNKIQTSVAKINNSYSIKIDKVHIKWISRSLELNGIKLISKPEQIGKTEMNASVSSIHVSGIRVFQWLFNHQIEMREILVIGSDIRGKIPFGNKNGLPIVTPMNIRIGELLFDTLQGEISNTLNAQTWSLEKGIVKFSEIQLNERDTLSAKCIHGIDFKATVVGLVSSDSLYAYQAHDIIYSGSSKAIVVDRFNIQPAFPDEEFAAKHEFQTDRIEADFKRIFVYSFSVTDFVRYGSIKSSFVEIGNMDIKVFRDKRMKFSHENKPVFQEMIRNYPALLSVDTVSLLNGDINYAVHTVKANESGNLSFKQVRAKIYKISNDSIYKLKKAFFELQAEGFLMGQGKLIVQLKSEINQPSNVFSLVGSLSEMEASALNPILEKSALIKVNAGKITSMNFDFVADDTNSTGSLILLYQGLDLAILNKKTEKTTALKEEIISAFINMKVLDSNPLKGEGVRKGIIYSKRDPEKFLFNYCFRSIVSGIEYSIVKTKKK